MSTGSRLKELNRKYGSSKGNSYWRFTQNWTTGCARYEAASSHRGMLAQLLRRRGGGRILYSVVLFVAVNRSESRRVEKGCGALAYKLEEVQRGVVGDGLRCRRDTRRHRMEVRILVSGGVQSEPIRLQAQQ